MNENKVPGIWKWSVLLLVLCNIGLIVTIWLKPHWGNHQRPESPRDYVIRNLKFSDDQVARYDVLIKDHRKWMNQLRAEAVEYRQALFSNIKNEPGGINTDSLTQLIANNQKQIETITYKHFAEVRKICTDAQKPEFDRIINDVIKKMNGNMRADPPRRGGGPGGPPEGPEGENPQGPPPPQDGPENH